MDCDPDTVGSIPRHLFGTVDEEQSLLWIRSIG